MIKVLQIRKRFFCLLPFIVLNQKENAQCQSGYTEIKIIKKNITFNSLVLQNFVNQSLFKIAICLSRCIEWDDGCLLILKSMTCDACICRIPHIHLPTVTHVLTYQGSFFFSFDKSLLKYIMQNQQIIATPRWCNTPEIRGRD